MPKLISSYYLIDTLVKTTSPREGCALTPRQAEVPTPIRLLAVPPVFKTELAAGPVNLPYKSGVFLPHMNTYLIGIMATTFAVVTALSMTVTLLIGKNGCQFIGGNIVISLSIRLILHHLL